MIWSFGASKGASKQFCLCLQIRLRKFINIFVEKFGTQCAVYLICEGCPISPQLQTLNLFQCESTSKFPFFVTFYFAARSDKNSFLGIEIKNPNIFICDLSLRLQMPFLKYYFCLTLIWRFQSFQLINGKPTRSSQLSKSSRQLIYFISFQ